MIALLTLILSTLLTACYVFIANRLALRRYHKSANEHWSERARLLFPARCAARTHVFAVPLAVGVISWSCFRQSPLTALAIGLVSWMGAIGATLDFDQKTVRRFDFNKWWKDVFRASLFFVVSWSLFCGAVVLMPSEWNWMSIGIPVSWLVVHTCLVWGGGIWLSQRLGIIHPASNELVERCQGVATKMSAVIKHVWTVPSLLSNAVALPFAESLILTEGLLKQLSITELDSVIAHECMHLKESRGVLCLRFVGTLSFMPWLFLIPLTTAYHIAGLLIISLVQICMATPARILARRMERRADHGAVKQEEDPGCYAQALLKIYEDNLLPAVMPRGVDVHHHLYDRLVQAGITPEFPRPKPASDLTPFRVMSIFLLIGSLTTMLFRILH